jgi:hypothetical protein
MKRKKLNQAVEGAIGQANTPSGAPLLRGYLSRIQGMPLVRRFPTITRLQMGDRESYGYVVPVDTGKQLVEELKGKSK